MFQCMAATPLAAAAKAALKSALEREHGGLKLHVSVVTPLVDYFAARGEAVTELPCRLGLSVTWNR